METRERDKTNTTNETGANFLLGEEDDIIAPELTQRGTHCESTQYIREQIIKQYKFKILMNQKVPQDKLTPPNLSDENDCFAQIDDLNDYLNNNDTENLITQARDCDQIRELVGPDHTIARRYQQLILTKIHCDQLIVKRKSLDIVLAKLKFRAQYKLYEFNKKTAENMEAFIKTIPRYNSKKLYCRNKHCKDCKHVTKPSLATYGLQKPGPRGRKQNIPQQQCYQSPKPQPEQQTHSLQYHRCPSAQEDLQLTPVHSYRRNSDECEEESRSNHCQGSHPHQELSYPYYDHPREIGSLPKWEMTYDHVDYDHRRRPYVNSDHHRGFNGYDSRHHDDSYDRTIFYPKADAREDYKDWHPLKRLRRALMDNP